MKFNDNWTKEDNDLYRKLIKENKSISDIISIMGIDKLRKNPKGKFISNFSKFMLEEIGFSRKNVIFSLDFSVSRLNISKQNYHVKFKSKNQNDYIVDFFYMKDNIGPYKNQDCYNLSFTLAQNYNISDNDIYELETNKNEEFDVLSKILFIVDQITETYKIKIVIVGLTKNDVKNQMYLYMIKSMNKEYILGESSINNGLDVYYVII